LSGRNYGTTSRLFEESEFSSSKFSFAGHYTPFRYRQREGGVVKTVLKDSQVVLATCHSSGGRQMANQEFDVVIIDEATQAIEAVSQ